MEFANYSINVDKAAIIKVTIPKKVFNVLNYTRVDEFVFKSGTTIVEREMLDVFNKSIIKIEHLL